MGKNKHQIGILGGSFDPIHIGHIGLAQEAYDKFYLDQILFMPAFQSPNKPNLPLASSFHRREMLSLALKEKKHFSISEFEVFRENLSYTIDTLDYCESKFPDSELFLIIGRDNLLDLDSWKDSIKIMKKCHILVASRPSQKLFSSEAKVLSFFNGSSPYKLKSKKNGVKIFFHEVNERRLIIFNINPRNISSSEIRKKIANREQTKNLLPPEVEAYIIRHKIYQTKFELNTK